MKPNTHLFKEKLKEIEKSDWVGNRAWWLKFVFHFTNIHNAVQILQSERLCSRNLAAKEELMKTDNASEEVMRVTEDKWKNYVRFYFRPRTPTQYYNEGFKTRKMIESSGLTAHCPVPVFFLFDSLSMLSMDGSYFTYGNLARSPEVYYEGKDFKEMPFQNIYHDDWKGFDDKIIFNRHAELIVENECQLNHLKYIVCRSQAEKETLVSLYNNFQGNVVEPHKIIVRPRLNMFYRKCFYIEKVSLGIDSIEIKFNKGEYFDEKYKLLIELYKINTDELITWKNDEFPPQTSLKLKFKEERPEYVLTIYIEDHIAYKSQYVYEYPLPF